jgi:predicted enzyme related to lactoylglutathione lyase
MPASATPLIEVAQIAVNVQDLARATAFYRDVLGLPVELEAPGLAFFRCGAVRLMLSRAERSEYDHPASIIYYRVADIDAAHAAMQAQVQFLNAPRCVHRDHRHELWLAAFRDSEGNTLALFCERPLA